MKVFINVLDLLERVDVFGEKGFYFSFSWETLQDLLKALEQWYGCSFSKMIIDAQGRLNPAIQIIIQGQPCRHSLKNPVRLREGNQVAVVAFLGSG